MSIPNSKPNTVDKNGLWWKILFSCLILLGVGAINGSWTQLDYKDWYNALSKPFFSPPPSPIVGLIWSGMYISMGFSVGIIWQIVKKSPISEQSKRARNGIKIFIIQIIVNMIVPIFFFALNNLYFLLVSVLINFILLLFVICFFYKVHKKSAYILLPYAVWLLYAILLDAGLLILN